MLPAMSMSSYTGTEAERADFPVSMSMLQSEALTGGFPIRDSGPACREFEISDTTLNQQVRLSMSLPADTLETFAPAILGGRTTHHRSRSLDPALREKDRDLLGGEIRVATAHQVLTLGVPRSPSRAPLDAPGTEKRRGRGLS